MAKNSVLTEGAVDLSMRNTLNNNFSDVSVASATLSATSGGTGTTLTNVAGMVTDVLVPGTYKFRIHIAGVATANSGLKAGLKFGTASMLTSIESMASGFTASAVAVQHSTTATDAASLFASTSAVIKTVIEGTVVVAIAGTLQLQAAQNASHADTTSVYFGSWMQFERITTG